MTTWLWTFWHLGPPLYSIAFAYLSRPAANAPATSGVKRHAGWIAVTVGLAGAFAASLVSPHFLDFLPKQVKPTAAIDR